MFELVWKKEGVYNVGTQVYLILTLRHKESGQVLVVAATHLQAKNDEKCEKSRLLRQFNFMKWCPIRQMKQERWHGQLERRKEGQGMTVVLLGTISLLRMLTDCWKAIENQLKEIMKKYLPRYDPHHYDG
eukprot:2870764-Ditylum_brightwellii.AAC.1